VAAKAIAMRKGLPLANGMECNNDQAESDCIEVVEPCTGGENPRRFTPIVWSALLDVFRSSIAERNKTNGGWEQVVPIFVRYLL
jgi:hypothetical protein